MTRILERENCKPIADVRKISREEWLGLRRKGIGGSDAAAIAGMDPYVSPLQIYLEKIGFEREDSDNDFARWGKRLEPVIRQHFPADYREHEGKSVLAKEFPYMLQSLEHPFMMANIDGLVELDPNEEGGLEIKTGNILMSKYWEEDSLPDQHYCQVQHYMAVTGFPFFMVVALIGKTLLWRRVPCNEEFIDALVERERLFWENHVLSRTPPDPAGIRNEGKMLLRLYPESEDITVELAEFEEAAQRRQELKAEVERLSEEIDAIDGRIKAAMRTAARARMGQFTALWSRYKRNSLDAQALGKELPDVYIKYLRQSDSQRFQIREERKR